MEADRPEAQPNPPPQLNFLPDEVCIVVNVSRTPDALPAPQVYETVMTGLNGRWTTLLAPQPSSTDSFGQDLAPSLTWRTLVPEAGPLQRSARHTDSQGPKAPWVSLPVDNTSSKLLCFYGIGWDPTKLEIQDRAALVRNLVLVVNRRLRDQAVPGSDAVTIVAATPHWLNGAANGGAQISGGPGSAPLPVPTQVVQRQGSTVYRTGERTIPTADLDFRFWFPKLAGVLNPGQQAAEGQTIPRVAVAILDTCPPTSQVKDAAAKYNTDGQTNDLLRRVVSEQPLVSLEEPPSLLVSDLNHLSSFIPNWRGGVEAWVKSPSGSNVRERYYNIADHGLFVAGIIKDIAPHADIHLIRVLDDAGIGDLQGITYIMSQLPSLFPVDESGKSRVVINLSLMVDVPPKDAMLPQWFPRSAPDFDEYARVRDR